MTARYFLIFVVLIVVMLGGCAESPRVVNVEVPAREETIRARVNAMMGSLISGINEAQILLIQRQGEAALARAESLIQRYPDVSYLHLLRASALTVLGRTETAREETARVLRDFPDDAPARALFTKLGGH